VLLFPDDHSHNEKHNGHLSHRNGLEVLDSSEQCNWKTEEELNDKGCYSKRITGSKNGAFQPGVLEQELYLIGGVYIVAYLVSATQNEDQHLVEFKHGEVASKLLRLALGVHALDKETILEQQVG